MYPRRSSLMQQSMPFTTLASIIRIAHKYEADGILQAATSRLESFLLACRPGHWLHSAAPWEERWDLGQQQCGIAFDLKDAVAAVNIVRLIEKPLLLPLALYLCCLTDDVLSLRDGVRRAGEHPEADVRDTLGDADFRCCVLALPVLSHQCHASVLRVLRAAMARTESFAQCRLRGACKGWIQEMFMDHAARDDGACRLDDLFVRLDRRVAPPAAFVQRSGALCPPCMERLLALSEEECVEMRRRLPTFFALFELVGWQ